jgi:hypothetical protein
MTREWPKSFERYVGPRLSGRLVVIRDISIGEALATR